VFRLPAFLLPVAALVLASPAAAEKPLDLESASLLGGAQCDLSTYKGDSQVLPFAFAIPDNQPSLSLVGTIATQDDGSEFHAVALEVAMAHTWMGDLVLRLEYVDCDDGTLRYGADVLCRPRGTNLLAPAPCGGGSSAGCSGNLGTTSTSTPPPEPASYFLSDSAGVPLGVGSCPGVAIPGCYLPSTPGAFGGFSGLAKGGCWRLLVADHADRDVGEITYWAVFTNNVPIVATRAASWGRLKTIYR